jgi:hypothetical protein
MSKKNAEFRGEFEIQVFSARGVQGSKNLHQFLSFRDVNKLCAYIFSLICNSMFLVSCFNALKDKDRSKT